jgi:DNA helicase II / ATP-dependent DNA helicase PcrA
MMSQDAPFAPHPNVHPRLLDNLNPEQLKAITLGHESALVLAGAGSGKTRVLTTRIAYLIQSGQATPGSILAVTFTNKAAKEMLTRLSAMMPINTRGMWVGTFHGLCNRLLRAHHRDANLPQTFQILDSADQQSAIKRLMKTLNIDDEKFKPKEMGWFINGAKDQGLRANMVEAKDEFTRRQVEFYQAYDEQCQREGVVDFAELLLRCKELLAKNTALLEHYRARFKFILVDEFQDTNRLQYQWIQLLAGSNTAVFGVGDDDQCLVAGSKITMADETTKAIERVRVGDEVLSCYGAKRFKPARVMRVHRRKKSTSLVEITLASGKKIVSTPEHTHFAGYVLGETPQTFFTYVMWKRNVGYRVGTSQVYTKGQRKPMLGFKQRVLQEHADALWIIGTHESENAARQDEMLVSLQYALPTLPFVPRKGVSKNGLVHDANWIASVFAALDTHASVLRLFTNRHLDINMPHHVPSSRDAKRRNINITLCGDGRGKLSMHRIAVGSNDVAIAHKLVALGLSVRPAKKSSPDSWRFETSFSDFAKLRLLAEKIRVTIDGTIKCRAGIYATPLPFVQASHVCHGMAMVDSDGALDFVVSVKRLPKQARTVFDLDIAQTHNYIANGIITHNSIYAFRGAEAANMRDFQRDFARGNVIKLEQNYRSQGNILDAANAVIANNKDRLGKNLWTDEGEGEPIRIYAASTDADEAQFVIDEVKALHREGKNLSEMALLYRSNAQSRVLEHTLFRAGVAYRVYGGLRFFERMEVKHALAYLRLAGNPADDGAFSRVVNFPPRGIGARSVEQVQELAKRYNVSLYEAALNGIAQNAITGRSAAAIGTFLRVIEGLKSSGDARLSLAELVDEALEKSGMKSHYTAEREGADRLENLAELVTACAQFEEIYEGEDSPLVGFLTHASLEAGDHEAAVNDDALQLMTVHAAKGLEFDHVFLGGLEEGLFPHENSLSDFAGVEEERRLMYVAITRARKRLYLSYAAQRMLHGQTRYGIVSRFLDEIPAPLCKFIVVPEKQAAYGGNSSGNYGGNSWGNQSGTRGSYGSELRGGKSGGGSGGSSTYTGFNQTIPKDENAVEYGREGAPDVSRANFETAQKSALPFGIGQNVNHAKFGDGVVLAFEGRGSDARVQVKFRREGTKWLALQYAKLTTVS